VDKAIGERRITNFTPVGISLCEELDVAAVLADVAADDKEAQQKVTCHTLDGSYTLWAAFHSGYYCDGTHDTRRRTKSSA
jgi:hypothetical protein